MPIHYGLDDPPNYVEVTGPLDTLLDIAARRRQLARHLHPGETLTLETGAIDGL